MFGKDKILNELKETWNHQEPHLRNIQIILDNKLILEREGDESRRKVAQDFLELLNKSINRIIPEVVRTKTGYGLFLDYSEILKEKFQILFYKFEDGNEDLGYWVEGQKMLYVNILNQDEFLNILKSKQHHLLFEIYQSTIFHELIHRFDHMRYSGSHRPVDYGNYMNTYEEFNAFFQQYARSVDRIVKNIKDLNQFYKRFGTGAGNLIEEFWSSMPEEMKSEIKSSKKWTNRWNKRVYQLYYEELEKLQKRLTTPKNRICEERGKYLVSLDGQTLICPEQVENAIIEGPVVP